MRGRLRKEGLKATIEGEDYFDNIELRRLPRFKGELKESYPKGNIEDSINLVITTKTGEFSIDFCPDSSVIRIEDYSYGDDGTRPVLLKNL